MAYINLFDIIFEDWDYDSSPKRPYWTLKASAYVRYFLWLPRMDEQVEDTFPVTMMIGQGETGKDTVLKYEINDEPVTHIMPTIDFHKMMDDAKEVVAKTDTSKHERGHVTVYYP